MQNLRTFDEFEKDQIAFESTVAEIDSVYEEAISELEEVSEELSFDMEDIFENYSETEVISEINEEEILSELEAYMVSLDEEIDSIVEGVLGRTVSKAGRSFVGIGKAAKQGGAKAAVRATGTAAKRTGQIFTKTFAVAKERAKAIMMAAKDKVIALLKAAKDKFTAAMATAKTKTGAAAKMIKDKATAAYNAIKTKTSAIMKTAKEKADAIIAKVKKKPEVSDATATA